MSLPELVDWQERKINELRAAVAEKDAHIAALVARIPHAAMLGALAADDYAKRAEHDGFSLSEFRHEIAEAISAHLVLANLPAAAAAYTADVRAATIREVSDATGEPTVCPECGASFYTPGNLNIALHADKEWRETYTARITADVRRAALEEAAKIADEQSLRYRSDAERSAAARQYGKWSEADGGAILAEFIARDIRALAAQPEGK